MRRTYQTPAELSELEGKKVLIYYAGTPIRVKVKTVAAAPQVTGSEGVTGIIYSDDGDKAYPIYINTIIES